MDELVINSGFEKMISDIEALVNASKNEFKMERLRRMDQSVTKPGVIISMTVGIIRMLILGLGWSQADPGICDQHCIGYVRWESQRV